MTPEDKGEAVCFTAGPQGAPFGAGVIHAWLVADRPAPKVVAGISTGSITAAAMQRAMIERGRAEEPTDASRWGWFQGYLTDVLDRPLDVIWKAFPDPVDYFSATMPVRDLSCPDELKPDERNFRYHFWQLTKIGKWMSCVAVSIGQIGKALILKVRLDEAIPVPVLGTSFAARMWRWITFLIQASTILIRIMHAVVWHPGFTLAP